MADNFLNYTGLGYFKDKCDTEYTNVIETVKVNGTALVPDANKAVDIDMPTDLSDLTNTGADPYATEDYVDQHGGKIDVIKVNGTTQTITNKTVDITVPTDLDDLTNTGADPYAQMSDVEAAVTGALKPKGSVAFASLPQLTAANLNNMYNVTDAFTTTADFVEGEGVSYPAGTNVAIINTGTDANPVYKYDCYTGTIDTSTFWTSATGQTNTLVAITTSQIDALFA